MPLDDCTHTFVEPATTVLPSYMAARQTALEHPHPLSGFCTRGVGTKTIMARLGRSRDFSGCYVLLREGKPFCVGISRSVISRLRQHSTGTSEFNATLAYRTNGEGESSARANAARSHGGPSFPRGFQRGDEGLEDSSTRPESRHRPGNRRGLACGA